MRAVKSENLKITVWNSTTFSLEVKRLGSISVVRVRFKGGLDAAKKTNIISKDVIFGSNTKSAQKLASQMTNRGWTEKLVKSTIDMPYTTRASINKATGNAATVFYTQKGSYVIVDDITKVIVQVSDNINPSTWVPDMSIINPYIPK